MPALTDLSHTLTASYSLLRAWELGKSDDAVKMYFRFDRPSSEAMENGKNYHAHWATQLLKTKTCDLLAGRVLTHPVVEKRYEASRFPWLSLAGVIDCHDEDILFEWKTGKTTASTYIDTHQIGLYGYLLKMAGVPIRRAEVWRMDTTKGETDGIEIDVSFCHMTPDRMGKAVEWAEGLAYEIHEFFSKQGYYDKYGARRKQKEQQ
ncbi:MAG: hypothetical protein QME66_04300 [Candidatus Eisenbacteria bacterium]|nr:hypothetical protein [Candidatus Eisenbacteria bacterium]